MGIYLALPCVKQFQDKFQPIYANGSIYVNDANFTLHTFADTPEGRREYKTFVRKRDKIF